MKTYSMVIYAPLFVDKDKAHKVFNEICLLNPSDEEIVIDMTGIESMTTICARIIFGELAKKIGLQTFYKQFKFRGLSNEVELVIDMGIASALES